MTQPSPQRRFWQIHLSTLITTALIASLFLWWNIQPRLGEVTARSEDDAYCTVTYGMPYTAATRSGGFYEESWSDRENARSSEKLSPEQVTRNFDEYFRHQLEIIYFDAEGWAMLPKSDAAQLRWNVASVLLDVLCLLVALAIATIAIEWITRRMKRGAS